MIPQFLDVLYFFPPFFFFSLYIFIFFFLCTFKSCVISESGYDICFFFLDYIYGLPFTETCNFGFKADMDNRD